MSRPLPSEIGCAFGFSMAGSGLGAFTGSMIAGTISRLFPEAVNALGTPKSFMFKGLETGMFSGILLGAVIGILYAQLVKRRRLRIEREQLEIKDSEVIY
jgi:phosphotransferase system  glucose/maltose/N-acetylglucosamine-specific IIC component